MPNATLVKKYPCKYWSSNNIYKSGTQFTTKEESRDIVNPELSELHNQNKTFKTIDQKLERNRKQITLEAIAT